MSEVILRQAVSDDLEQMYLISVLAHQQGYDELIPSDYKDDFRQRYTINDETRARYAAATQPYIDQKDHNTLVALIDDQVVGYVTMLRSDDQVKLKSIFVHPKSQGSGVGSILFRAALDWAGQSEMTLTVIAANERAKHLYEKYGFEQVGSAPKQFFGADQIIMKRSVQDTPR